MNSGCTRKTILQNVSLTWKSSLILKTPTHEFPALPSSPSEHRADSPWCSSPSGPEAPCALCNRGHTASPFSGGLTTEHPSLSLPIMNISHWYFHKRTHNLQLTLVLDRLLCTFQAWYTKPHQPMASISLALGHHILLLPFEGFRLVLHLCVITANVHVTLRLQELVYGCTSTTCYLWREITRRSLWCHYLQTCG